jgi:hypothetical protein
MMGCTADLCLRASEKMATPADVANFLSHGCVLGGIQDWGSFLWLFW